MSRRALKPVIAVVLVALAGCAEAPPPREFVSKEHKFRAQFGSEPKVRGYDTHAVYSVKREGGSLWVVVVAGTEAFPPDKIPMLLETAKANIIRDAHGQEISDAPIPLGGKYSGRDFTFERTKPAKQTARVRIYLVGTRLYQVWAAGMENYTTSAEATTFLDSFQLLE
jgi:hypothetical protein